MSQPAREDIAQLLRLQHGHLEGRYLGLPLFFPRSRSQACRELKEKVSKRVSGWKAKSLSQAGRTVLIQAVATALPTHYMAVSCCRRRFFISLIPDSKNFGGGF